MQKDINHTNEIDNIDIDDAFFVHEKEKVHEIQPDPVLLTNIFNKINEQEALSRSQEALLSHVPKGIPILSPYVRYFKMISSTTLASALVLLFMLKANTHQDILEAEHQINTRLAVAGQETIDIDSIVADLSSSETVAEEATLDDSDILNELGNTNSYEIQ